MKNIHVLPTDKASKLVLNNQKELWFNPDFSCKSGLAHPQNIYITSDENIKEGDWFYYKHFGEDIIDKTNKNTDLVNLNNPDKYFRKIILTDDPDLIVDGVQSIDDEFLEWFVKNPSCEEVVTERVVVYDDNNNGSGEIFHSNRKFAYEIIIPQEEPKQEIVGYKLKPSIDRMMVDGILKNAMPIWNDEDKSVYFIRGHVAGSLVAKMKELQVLDLWFTPIYENEEVKSDWVKEHHLEYYHKEGIMKPKQETLEEAADIERIAMDKLKNKWGHLYLFGYPQRPFPTNYENDLNNIKIGLYEGAKWQAERMYSEEDMIEFGEWCENLQKDNKEIRRSNPTISKEEIFQIWRKQFKKK